jgi:large subunit ribosomal protein L21
MYAIIKTGGKQYKVAEGDVVDVELLNLEAGASVEFSDVLFISSEKEHKVGQPSIKGFVVKGEVLGEAAGPKIESVKYKPRKRQLRRFGHKQHYSRVKISKIAQV